MECLYGKSTLHTIFSPMIRNKNMLIMPNILLSKYFLKVVTLSYLNSSNFKKLNLLYLKTDLGKKTVLGFKAIPVCFQTGLELWNGRISLQITYITVFS